MSELRTRKCCPKCKSLEINRRIWKHGYTCQKCGKDFRSQGLLRMCPSCKSRSLVKYQASKYTCLQCLSNFDVPALKNARSYNYTSHTLLPKAEVRA